MALLLNLRKRWVLAAIFCTSVMYFFYNTAQFVSKPLNKDNGLLQAVKNKRNAENILRKLKWHVSSEKSRNYSDFFKAYQMSCRNSLQGKDMVADEEGYVCNRKDIKFKGCCDVFSKSSERYVCASCVPSNCCTVYEHCVSCCMKPDNRQLLEKIIRETVNNLQQLFLSSINDQFDLCLLKCRTSSRSVQHENTYRNAKLKYCFGRSAPDIKLS